MIKQPYHEQRYCIQWGYASEGDDHESSEQDLWCRSSVYLALKKRLDQPLPLIMKWYLSDRTQCIIVMLVSARWTWLYSQENIGMIPSSNEAYVADISNWMNSNMLKFNLRQIELCSHPSNTWKKTKNIHIKIRSNYIKVYISVKMSWPYKTTKT